MHTILPEWMGMGKYAYMEIHIEKLFQLPAIWTLIA